MRINLCEARHPSAIRGSTADHRIATPEAPICSVIIIIAIIDHHTALTECYIQHVQHTPIIRREREYLTEIASINLQR
jgi:hypothetical protein